MEQLTFFARGSRIWDLIAFRIELRNRNVCWETIKFSLDLRCFCDTKCERLERNEPMSLALLDVTLHCLLKLMFKVTRSSMRIKKRPQTTWNKFNEQQQLKLPLCACWILPTTMKSFTTSQSSQHHYKGLRDDVMIYFNENYGSWFSQSDWTETARH